LAIRSELYDILNNWKLSVMAKAAVLSLLTEFIPLEKAVI